VVYYFNFILGIQVTSLEWTGRLQVCPDSAHDSLRRKAVRVNMLDDLFSFNSISIKEKHFIFQISSILKEKNQVTDIKVDLFFIIN